MRMSYHLQIWIKVVLNLKNLQIRTSVLRQTLQRRHELPFPGRILVAVGDRIDVGASWAVCDRIGRTSIRDVSRLARIPPAQTPEATRDAQDCEISAGAVVVKGTGSLFGSRQWSAQWNGKLAHVSSISGLGFFQESMAALPLLARLSGKIVEVAEGSHIVIEGTATALRCAYGAGGTSFGRITLTDSSDLIPPVDDPSVQCVVVTTETLSTKSLDHWVPHAAAIVAPSMAAETLLALQNSRVSDSSATQQWDIPIVLTEGISSARMPPVLQQLFRNCDGQSASVVATSTPGEAEILVIQEPGSIDSLAPLAMRIAAGPELGTQVSARTTEVVEGRNSAGIVGAIMNLHREEGGKVQVLTENLEELL